MKCSKYTLLLLWIFTFNRAQAELELPLKDETVRLNYSLGYQIGTDFKKQGVKLDSAAILQGIEDALAAGKPLMEPQEMHTALVQLKRKVVAEQQARNRDSDLLNLAADKQYLEEATKKPDMHTSETGLVYKVINPGKGRSLTVTDTVTVNYRGTLTNGNEFDSSYKHGKPASFPLNGVIKGWTEGLQLIKEGGKIQLIIPANLAYGDHGPLAHRTLLFDIELLSVGEKVSDSSDPAGKAGQAGKVKGD